MSPESEVARWMRHCLSLAARGAGGVSPNPLVGAVVLGVDGAVLGEGWHAQYGGAHAEVRAIGAAEAAAGPSALEEATLVVNLEPCAHVGKTPPCTDLILEKRIPRVVVGMRDPFPMVDGQGIRKLTQAGVEVSVGILEPDCRRLNEAYLRHLRTGRPLVILKMAQSLDGSVATSLGDSRWVSGEESRALVHRWRSEVDAVLVGSGTAAADDPSLTVRHVEGRQPLRIVLDRAGALPPNLKLFSDDAVPRSIAVTGPEARPAYGPGLLARGGRLLRVAERAGHLDLAELLGTLGKPGTIDERPVQSILIEAGPRLATALFSQDLVDRFYLFVAPKLVGSGRPTLGELSVERMNEALTFSESRWERVGEDLLFRGYRRQP